MRLLPRRERAGAHEVLRARFAQKRAAAAGRRVGNPRAQLRHQGVHVRRVHVDRHARVVQPVIQNLSWRNK